MPKSLLLGAALLLSSVALGVTLAAAPHHGRERGEAARDGHHARPVLAEDRGMGGHGERHHGRHDDDDDDEGDEGGRTPAARPPVTDPNAPAPDSGLFNGRARPKVDVQ
jgi:hypothetical protein